LTQHEPTHPRVGIRGKPGVLLVAGIDNRERGTFQMVEHRQHVIARNTEDMADIMLPEPFDKVIGDPDQPAGLGGFRVHHDGLLTPVALPHRMDDERFHGSWRRAGLAGGSLDAGSRFRW